MSVKQGLVITMDGPAGTGKSTAARELAKRLGYLYLDTGAMYRAIALQALRKRMTLTDKKGLIQLAQRARIGFRVDPGHRLRVTLDGADVTEAIREHKVSEAASQVAVIPGVRRVLVRRQKQLGAQGRIVAEGRDTGTVVFPKADLKFFLTASALARAKRRLADLKTAGERVSPSQVLRDTKERDLRDESRSASPLKAAAEAVVIDNTRLQSSQVIDRMLVYVERLRRKRGNWVDRRVG